MNVASLCAGIGGADLALESHGHRIAWHAEYDLAPSKVLAHHWPDVPNIGDITTADWSACEPVDLISAGYPCQPFSAAGLRKGTDDDRHLWPFIRDAIGALRPRYVFLENVVGHFSLGAAVVVHDLAQIGYMSTWGSLGSHHVGGCHRRDRFWLLAADTTNVGCERDGLTRRRWDGPPHGDRRSVDLLPTPTAGDGTGGHRATNLEWRGGTAYRPSGAKASVSLQEAVDLLPTPTVSQGRNATSGRQEGAEFNTGTTLLDVAYAADFGRYHRAVDRWARIFGPPPAPTDHKGRLNPPFVEWMLGFPAGWATDLDIARTAQLKALGNAQQPQVAALAFSLLAQRLTSEGDD